VLDACPCRSAATPRFCPAEHAADAGDGVAGFSDAAKTASNRLGS
jgi:hypothetical protein